MKRQNIIIAAILGVAFVLAAAVMSITFYKIKTPKKTISVIGLAEKDFVSDLIVWDFYYNAHQFAMKDAYADMKAQTAKVKQYLQDKEINNSEIIFDAISTTNDYRYEWEGDHQKSYFNGYILSQKVRVTSKDVEKIEKVAREITELIDKGITIRSEAPQYFYTKLSDLKIEMLAEATEDAKHRAETITQHSGASIDKLQTASMGVFQITAPNSADDDYTWGGTFNTSSKMKRASINMRLTYSVN